MTIDEIFSQINQHMITGLMFHSQLADFYNFLGLKGYSKCHEYHFMEECNNHRKMVNYYLTHFNKLIVDPIIQNPQIIPEKWFKYSRQDVDMATRKSAMQLGIDKWVTWEQSTKNLYEQMYKELLEIGEVAAAAEIKCYIVDVDCELANAQQEMIEEKMIDFNISDIMTIQEDLYQKYINKLKEVELC